MLNKLIVRAIYFGSYFGALAIACQAIRFCQGNVGAPVIDQLWPLFGAIAGVDRFFGVHSVLYYVCGVGVWLSLSLLYRWGSWKAGRIVEVGRTQFRAEREAFMRLAAAEEERLTRQSQAREAKIPRAGVPFSLLVLAFLVGTSL